METNNPKVSDYTLINDHIIYNLEVMGFHHGEMLLFAKIYSACGNGTKVANLTNAYLCNYFRISESTVTRWIQGLRKASLLDCDVCHHKEDGAFVTSRHFAITDKGIRCATEVVRYA